MKLKLVKIRWCDACDINYNWKHLDDIMEDINSKNWECETVGWILKETKEYIAIASTLSTDYAKFVIKIPTTWIRSKKILKL